MSDAQMTRRRGTALDADGPRYRCVDGLSVRYVESARSGPDALLLSPWPESVFAFESIWPDLTAHAHLVAVDLPGFGRSQRRDDLMSPRAMGEFVSRLAEAFDLEHPHLVGLDIGTSAALFAAAREPRRWRSLVVGSGAATYPIDLAGALREWVFAPDLDVYRRIDGKRIVERVMETLERHQLSDAARDDYVASYQGERFAASMAYVRAYPSDLPVLAELLPPIETPVLILAGRRDRVVPLANAEFLHDRLPNSQLHILDSGHFTWEDCSEDFSRLVRQWWRDGHATCAFARCDGASGTARQTVSPRSHADSRVRPIRRDAPTRPDAAAGCEFVDDRVRRAE